MGKKTQFKVYSIVEITNGIKVIEEKISSNDVYSKDVKIFKKLIKEIKNDLKMVNNIGHIKSNSNYSILKHLVDKRNELSYDALSLFTPTSDLIKLFQEHCDKFNDEEYWKNLAYAYILQNYKKMPYKVYYELFSSRRPRRECLMSEEEQNLLKKFPQQIIIYRGGTLTEQKTKKYGISWTLDRQIAANFASVKAIRDEKEMVVIEKSIEKKDIIAYFTERQEEEIIYLG